MARVALVSGGGRGVGRAVALRLAADGLDVAVVYRRDAEAAAEVCCRIEALGRRARAFQASVADGDDVARLAVAVQAELGPLDVLVSNAGIASRGRSVVDTEPDEMSRVMATHAFGAHLLARAFVPGMRSRGRADVVVVSSVATERPSANGAPYMMAKAALEALARTLALEEMQYGIRVNIVAPGLVVTDMGDRLAQAVAGVDGAAALDAGAPYGRVCRPEDVANVVAFLVSDDGAYVNGQRLAVDGGMPGVVTGRTI